MQRTRTQPSLRGRRGTVIAVLAMLAVIWLVVMAGPGPVEPAGSATAELLPVTLVSAIQAGNVDEVARLLEDGADPDSPDTDGTTPLMLAAARDDTEVVQHLLEAGADPNRARPDRTTALLVAVDGGATGTLELLLATGVDP